MSKVPEYPCSAHVLAFSFPLSAQADPSLLEVFALGASVLTLITLFHGWQIGHIVRRHHRYGKRALENVRPTWTVSVRFRIAIVHVVVLREIDVGIWPFVLYITGLIPNSHAGGYFTASSYTSLSTLPLGAGWRDLSPMVCDVLFLMSSIFIDFI